MAPKLKVKKPTIVKSFRLIDFHIYDEVPQKEEAEDDDDDDDDVVGNYGGTKKSRPYGDNLQFMIQMLLF